MKKPAGHVLLLFGTREGQTEKITSRIAEQLQRAGLSTRVLNAADSPALDSLRLEDFDLLVFGASMHAGGLEPELVNFVNARACELKTIPRSFFLVLLSAATQDQSLRESWLGDARQKMNQQLETKFADTEFIAGALKYSRYSWPMKWLMRRIARRSGGDTDISRDYEYTDWEQVYRYAQRLIELTQASTAGQSLHAEQPPPEPAAGRPQSDVAPCE